MKNLTQDSALRNDIVHYCGILDKTLQSRFRLNGVVITFLVHLVQKYFISEFDGLTNRNITKTLYSRPQVFSVSKRQSNRFLDLAHIPYFSKFD